MTYHPPGPLLAGIAGAAIALPAGERLFPETVESLGATVFAIICAVVGYVLGLVALKVADEVRRPGK